MTREAARRLAVTSVSVFLLVTVFAPSARAQTSSYWVDVSGARSRAPTSDAAAATYGLLGARVRVDSRGSTFEAAATGGRGVENAGGSWVNARAAYDVTRVIGMFDIGGRIQTSGLGYITAVQLGNDVDFKQTTASASVQPQLGISIAGFRAAIEGTLTRGIWRTTVTT
ncbi:MAG: hypothetical protein ABIV28_09095, partial [Longimicrobiales bacterium]